MKWLTHLAFDQRCAGSNPVSPKGFIIMNEKLKKLIGKKVVDIDVNYDRGIDCEEYIDSIEFEDGTTLGFWVGKDSVWYDIEYKGKE